MTARRGVATHPALPVWLRGPAHLERDWICLDEARRSEYEPLAEDAELLLTFATLDSPLDALGFVRRYGLLRSGPGSAQHRERWKAWEGDIARVGLALELVAASRRAADCGEDDELRALESRGLREWSGTAATSTPDLIEYASLAAAEIVTEGFRATRFAVAPMSMLTRRGKPVGPPTHYIMAPVPDSLLGVIYYQLSQVMVHHAALARCENCSRFYRKRRRDQRYCTTRCGNSARGRRFDEKKREIE